MVFVLSESVKLPAPSNKTMFSIMNFILIASQAFEYFSN